MTEYNKETVATLRQWLKDRGIPSTGLTRKAQIIEKLKEWDDRNAAAEEEREGPVEVAPDAAQPEEVAEAAEPAAEAAPLMSTKPGDEAPADAPDASTTEQAAQSPVAAAQAPVEEAAEPEIQKEQDGPITRDEASAPAAEDADKAQIPTESHATDFAKHVSTPSPSPDEKQSIEKPELAPVAEQSASTTTEPSRLNTEELEADTRKRKRRSLTPEVSAQEIRAKKPRPSEDDVHEVAAAKDEDIVMDQRPPEEAEKELDEQAMEAESANGHQKAEANKPEPEAETKPQPPPNDHPLADKKERVPLYRDLFQPAPDSLPPDTLLDSHTHTPALHPATSALYIRNLMRPLRPEPLRSHLTSLATPPSSSPDPSIISALFLDAMKTHALVRFANTAAASRVRASLHGTVWPPEGNRKDLWVDFIPEEKCSEWIAREEEAAAAEKEDRAAGRPVVAKKFEVVYEDDGSGSMTAVFQEVGAGAAAFNPPKGPRDTRQAPQQVRDAVPAPEARHDAEKSFRTLDELFESTTAKPKLYFLPVPSARANARLRDLDAETSRDWTPEEKRKGRGMQGSARDVKLRYTFDDEDRVVEAGGDFGPWSEARAGGYRARRKGGWRSGP